jgi:hypothetical protein
MAYIVINGAALAFVSVQASNFQKTSFIPKSIAKGFSLFIYEEQEKEKEGDEHEEISGFISFAGMLVFEKVVSKEFPLPDFDGSLTASKIYLQHRSLQL